MTSLKFGRPTFLRVFLMAPVLRVWGLSADGKVAAMVAAVVTFLWNDMYFTLLPALVIAGALDTFEGRKAAKLKRGKRAFDESLFLVGLHSKVSAAGITAFFRYLEWWGEKHGLVHTSGFVAVALTLALIGAELDSYNRHRRALGKRPIPLLSQAITWVRAIATQRLQAIPAARSETGEIDNK